MGFLSYGQGYIQEHVPTRTHGYDIASTDIFVPDC